MFNLPRKPRPEEMTDLELELELELNRYFEMVKEGKNINEDVFESNPDMEDLLEAIANDESDDDPWEEIFGPTTMDDAEAS